MGGRQYILAEWMNGFECSQSEDRQLLSVIIYILVVIIGIEFRRKK